MYKLPVSVLVVIHTLDLDVLLLERTGHPGYWQSVTGSQHHGESLRQTALREIREETGLNPCDYPLSDWETEYRYEIFKEWRWRYAPDITHNTEHVFSLCLPEKEAITIAPEEHLNYLWLPWRKAADKVFSWSNAETIRNLPQHLSEMDEFSLLPT
ncbi:MAG: dihydroneopterin triphosphate diphosphatase [Burkholderiales bacterium]|uniref:dihydroneopterin triphosphate diphosphatase n=1 Tax=Nitrosomonas sp. TaxID=42353 RepID=UPI001D6B632A|nr:dihydroneopterin triphosphate diphosphatase [Nitrosomonas sp.]MCB1948334.1 dihydroneopterin triphosphate diphosphatase [Nitrosomonas sp.]MCP5241953.1 dihydroneopterin triphosphate diphosphatase [Burkholderiales bacterium]